MKIRQESILRYVDKIVVIMIGGDKLSRVGREELIRR